MLHFVRRLPARQRRMLLVLSLFLLGGGVFLLLN